jgi:hypothetical protein
MIYFVKHFYEADCVEGISMLEKEIAKMALGF